MAFADLACSSMAACSTSCSTCGASGTWARCAEGLYGHWTFALVYLISGIGGSLASVWWRPVGVSAGASGAIFGIVGALIASHYLGEFSAPMVVVRSRLRSVLVFAGYSTDLRRSFRHHRQCRPHRWPGNGTRPSER